MPRTTTDVDYYDVLGITADASADDIKRAYRKLARATHPDVGGSAALFRLIGDAWHVLGDEGRKTAYDYDRRKAAERARTGSTPPRDEAPRDADDQGHEPRQHASAPRSRATVIGTVNTAANEAKFGQRGTVGAAGERAVAAALDQVELTNAAFVFHDLEVNGAGSNVDHVVLVGGKLLVIDAKAWRPGRYTWDPRSAAHRDGEPFEHGHPGRTIAVADQLVQRIGWTGPVEYVLAIAPSTGPASGLDLTGYRPPGLTTVRIDRVADLVTDRTADVDADTACDPQVLARLLAIVNDRRIVACHVPAVPPLDDIDATPPGRAVSAIQAVLAAASAWLVLSALVVGSMGAAVMLAGTLTVATRLAARRQLVADVTGSVAAGGWRMGSATRSLAIWIPALTIGRIFLSGVPLIGDAIVALLGLVGIAVAARPTWRLGLAALAAGGDALIAEHPTWDELVGGTSGLAAAVATNALRHHRGRSDVRRLLDACDEAGGAAAAFAARIRG